MWWATFRLQKVKSQQTRVYPHPLVAGSARPNPKMGAPDPENPLFVGFSVLRGGLRPWSQTMVSEGARPWGRGRSGDCERGRGKDNKTKARKGKKMRKKTKHWNMKPPPTKKIKGVKLHVAFLDTILTMEPWIRVHAKGVVLCERACFCLLSTF